MKSTTRRPLRHQLHHNGYASPTECLSAIRKLDHRQAHFPLLDRHFCALRAEQITPTSTQPRNIEANISLHPRQFSNHSYCLLPHHVNHAGLHATHMVRTSCTHITRQPKDKG